MNRNSTPAWRTEIDRLAEEYSAEEQKILEEYFTFLRFESISANPDYRTQTRACAMWVSDFLSNAGLKPETWETSGHPAIFAEWLGAGPDQPTVLIYNHYDVQPADPLNLWTTPPFEPTVRDGEVFARGAQDNKGQCISVLAAVRHLLLRDGKLPINVKLIIEGEEETGSLGLVGLLKEKADRLRADYLMVVDMGIPGPGIPSVTLGLRGIVTMTLELEGSTTDLHSGIYGGIVYNPNHAIVEMLAKLHDTEGRVAIPGFYDDIVPLSAAEHKEIDFDHDVSAYETSFGAKAVGGEKAFSPLESAWVRPTLEINGINGGYSGEGFKTVIPAKAIAKLSCRLVPNQEPDRILKLVDDFLRANVPDGIRMKLTPSGGSGIAIRSPANSPIVESTSEVLSALFGQRTQKILCGGSVPAIPELTKAAQAEVVLLGYGLESDNMHAPDEHFGIDRVKLGFITLGGLLERYRKP